MYEPNFCTKFHTDTSLLFSSEMMESGLLVFRKLNLRKYRYKDYVTTTVDILFLAILSNTC